MKFEKSSLFQAPIDQTIRQRCFPEIWYLVENYLAELNQGAVLDLGSGYGLLSEALAKSGWRVTAVDPNNENLLRLQHSFHSQNLAGRFEQCSPHKLIFTKHSFDAAVCANMLEFCEDPVQVIHELYRTLRPGGKAVIATFNAYSAWGITQAAKFSRPDNDGGVNCLSKSQLLRALQTTRFVTDAFKLRGRYLPIGQTRNGSFPYSGLFVVLVRKKKKNPQFAPTGSRGYLNPSS